MHKAPLLEKLKCLKPFKIVQVQTMEAFLHPSLISSLPRDSEDTTNEEEAISNFDFLQNEGEDENVNEEDDGDDGGNADDESDDREDEVKERRVVKKAKQGESSFTSTTGAGCSNAD